MTTGAASLVLSLLVVAWVVLIYNRLATLRHRVQKAYGQLDTQLSRRHTLAARLIERAACRVDTQSGDRRTVLQALLTARKYAQQAGAVARRDPLRAETVTACAVADGDLRLALATFRQRCPDLFDPEGDSACAELIESLDAVQQRTIYAAEAYASEADAFNTVCERWPDRLVAASFGFHSVGPFHMGDELSVPSLQVVCA